MTTLVHDPKDGDIIAIVYRDDDGTGWLAEVQKRWGGPNSFSLYDGFQLRATTRWGAKRAARRLLRAAARVERAKLSRANPLLVARERLVDQGSHADN